MRAELEAAAPRVACPQHGVVVAAVPWARHGAAHTRFFDDQVAWLAAACSKTTITQLMRISWRTVGTIIARVSGEAEAATDRLAGLRRIGIDEVSYKRGHKYLVIVVNHDTGLLIWAAPGRDASTVHAFSGQLGEERCKLLTHLSADGAEWISGPAAARAPQAALCADPFHVVSWAAGALDEVRREVWRTARRAGAIETVRHGSRTIRISSGDARSLARARYALWKNPENLSGRQEAKLAWIEKTHPYLWRAYLLKEGLRTVFRLKGEEGKYALARWLSWAVRCRIPEFTELAKKDPQAPSEHPRDPRPRAQQWPDRIGEHQDKGHHADGLRVPQPRRPHRARHARPRRPPPRPPRKVIKNLPTKPAGGPQMTVTAVFAIVPGPA